MVAWVHPNDVAYSWFASMLALQGHFHGSGRRGRFLAMRYGSGGIVEARNKVVDQFMASDEDWLFWIDTDMGFTADTVDRLLEVADPDSVPVVGGLCFANREVELDGFGGFATIPVPTVYRWAQNPDGTTGFTPWHEYPRDQLYRCEGTGAACILIHRSVLERMRDKHGPNWYSLIANPATGGAYSEDLSFCIRLAELGVPLHVHTGVKTTHLKQIWLSELHHDMYRMIATGSTPRVDVDPSDERVTVIVPVVGRPQNAERFMRSLRASTGLADVIVVCEEGDDDTEQAWLDTDADMVIVSEAKSFPDKVNKAFGFIEDTPWIFLAGDDVVFRPAWLDHAVATAKATGAKVVGTNDLANKRVMAGEHATHMLIATDYVREVGSSWDGPGVVCHGGYRHWFVDDEIVTAAKQRDVWAHSPHSIVEHMHPIAGKAEVDETYRKGERHAKKDQALYVERLRANIGEPVAA